MIRTPAPHDSTPPVVHDDDDDVATTMRASRSLIWPLSLLHLCLTALATSYEQFDEDLVLTPLLDGKVSAAFTFTTVLHGAAPRDPHTLNSPDECA